MGPDRLVATGLRLHDRPRRVHQPDMAERLREVPEQLTGRGVNLLGEEAEVTGEADARWL